MQDARNGDLTACRSPVRVLWANHAASVAHAEHVEAFWHSHCPPQLSREVLSTFADSQREGREGRPTLQDGDPGVNVPKKENQLGKMSNNAYAWHIFVLPEDKVKKVGTSDDLTSKPALMSLKLACESVG